MDNVRWAVLKTSVCVCVCVCLGCCNTSVCGALHILVCVYCNLYTITHVYCEYSLLCVLLRVVKYVDDKDTAVAVIVHMLCGSNSTHAMWQ